MSSSPCLFNLLVSGEDPKALERLSPLLTRFLSFFPGRLITLLSSEGTRGVLFEELPGVPLRSSRASTQKRVAISASGYSERERALLPLPYLIPDLPLLLFWLPERAEGELFESLYRISDRLLLDGEEALSPLSHAQTMGRLLQREVPLIDVAWSQGEGWRDLLRELLSTKERLETLEECRLLQISYQSGSSLPALYFQAWLAKSAGWSYKGRQGLERGSQLHYERGERPLTVELLEEHSEGARKGSLLRLHLTAESGKEIELFRKEEALEVEIRLSSKESCELPLTHFLPNPHRGATPLLPWLWGESPRELKELLPLIEGSLS